MWKWKRKPWDKAVTREVDSGGPVSDGCRRWCWWTAWSGRGKKETGTSETVRKEQRLENVGLQMLESTLLKCRTVLLQLQSGEVRRNQWDKLGKGRQRHFTVCWSNKSHFGEKLTHGGEHKNRAYQKCCMKIAIGFRDRYFANSRLLGELWCVRIWDVFCWINCRAISL